MRKKLGQGDNTGSNTRQWAEPDIENQRRVVQRSSALCRRPLRKKPPDKIVLLLSHYKIIVQLSSKLSNSLTCCSTILFPSLRTSGKSETKPKMRRPTSEVTPMQAIKRAARSLFSWWWRRWRWRWVRWWYYDGDDYDDTVALKGEMITLNCSLILTSERDIQGYLSVS